MLFHQPIFQNVDQPFLSFDDSCNQGEDHDEREHGEAGLRRTRAKIEEKCQKKGQTCEGKKAVGSSSSKKKNVAKDITSVTSEAEEGSLNLRYL